MKSIKWSRMEGQEAESLSCTLLPQGTSRALKNIWGENGDRHRLDLEW